MADRTMEAVLKETRLAFASGRTLPIRFRLTQLKNLLGMLNDHQDDIVKALEGDLRKAKMEARLYEVEICRAEINLFLRNLKDFVKKEKLPMNALASLDSAYVQPEPFGVVLVLGAWNYPFTLSLLPMIGAIAAGNCVILKPSEMAPHTAELLSNIIPRYLDSECFQVFQADLEGTKELLKSKFDYIFATGSANMGRSVMAAAAPHLTPLTLELGGKSPVYIDDSSDFELAAKRIMWGKCMNLGQTCIAPDYVLCSKTVEKEFLKVSAKVLTEWYGSKWQESQDLTRIINDRNFNRLNKMLLDTKGRIIFGGQTDQAGLWISPTVIVDVEESDSVMREEIFGPILPIVTVSTPEEAIEKILARPKPLSLYIFSKKTSVINQFVSRTSSGGVCINDVIWQNGWDGLPFGGVGESGFGTYHGKYSFDTFSHRKAVLHRGFSYLSEKLGEARYPPYTGGKMKFFTFVIRYIHAFNITGLGSIASHLCAGIAGAVILYLALRFSK